MNNEEKLNKLLKEQKEYTAEISKITGILNYYKDRKETRIHNSIIMAAFTTFLILLAGLSIYLIPNMLMYGITCLVATIAAGIIGGKITIKNLKEGKKILKEKYLEIYGIDIDTLAHTKGSKDNIENMEVTLKRNKILLKNTTTEINKIQKNSTETNQQNTQIVKNKATLLDSISRKEEPKCLRRTHQSTNKFYRN